MKFSLLINMKKPIKVDIFIFISRETFTSDMLSKKEFAIINNLIFVSRTNFMLSRVEHENIYTSGPECDGDVTINICELNAACIRE